MMESLIANFGQLAFPASGLVTVFAAALCYVLSVNVMRARMQYQVPAPAMDGPEAFLRRYRTHQNSLEQLVIFLPLLWVSALSIGDLAAAIPGVIWIVGRIIYAIGYYKAANARVAGFIITSVATSILFVEAFVGVFCSF